MEKGEKQFYLQIQAAETTVGEALGAVVGALIAVCCCIGAIAYFVMKKKGGSDSPQEAGEQDMEMSKDTGPPPGAAPVMGQPQQQM